MLSGSQTIRELTPGPSGLTWDGRDAWGQPAPDGTYTLYLETASADPAVYTPPATLQLGVNTNLPSPSGTWYLAEGYTGSNATGGEFDTFVLIQNPGDAAATVEVTFMQPGGANTPSLVLPAAPFPLHHPRGRHPARGGGVHPWSSPSQPVVAERAMYFNGGLAGHDTIGVNSPSTTWYLAEGYTGGDFDEWVLIQNPGDADAAVNVQFQTQGQGVVNRTYNIPPRSRFTIHVDDILPDANVSTYVSSSQPVVVERAQYLNFMRSGTCSIAARTPSYTWFFAEGFTGSGFEEWLLLQNPWDIATSVDLFFMQPDGTNSTMRVTVPARSRYSVPVHAELPGVEVSASISSQLPVVAERAMYWNGRSDGHATLGTPTPENDVVFRGRLHRRGLRGVAAGAEPLGRQGHGEDRFHAHRGRHQEQRCGGGWAFPLHPQRGLGGGRRRGQHQALLRPAGGRRKGHVLPGAFRRPLLHRRHRIGAFPARARW